MCDGAAVKDERNDARERRLPLRLIGPPMSHRVLEKFLETDRGVYPGEKPKNRCFFGNKRDKTVLLLMYHDSCMKGPWCGFTEWCGECLATGRCRQGGSRIAQGTTDFGYVARGSDHGLRDQFYLSLSKISEREKLSPPDLLAWYRTGDGPIKNHCSQARLLAAGWIIGGCGGLAWPPLLEEVTGNVPASPIEKFRMEACRDTQDITAGWHTERCVNQV